MTLSSTASDLFYKSLSPVNGFKAIDQLQNFQDMPDDWWVVISDVKNSTQAVKQGRYKEVNMIGASCITAILNQFPDLELPYVFGGDGAVLLVPGRVIEHVTSILVNVRELSRKEFDLDLRIGMVDADTIHQHQKRVMVAKHQISPGNYLAMFSGGGIELADHLIKHDGDCINYAIPDSPATDVVDLTGLSCRWQPLKSHNGQIICLLIQVLNEDITLRHQMLNEVMQTITDKLNDESLSQNPVKKSNLQFKWPPKGLVMEAKLTKARQSFLTRYLSLLYESFIQFILEKFNLSAGHYNAPVYREQIESNSDYRRFDDALRLVLDCTESQIEKIKLYLDKLHQEKKIAYGLHRSNYAQMTCLVFSLKQSSHVHFLDGEEGGFWSASVDFKKQISAMK